MSLAIASLVPHGLLGCAEADFPSLARAFRSELAPRNLLEGLQVDLAILALTLLRRATAALAAAPNDPKRLRPMTQAHTMLSQSLREFTRLRKAATAKTVAPRGHQTEPVASSPTPPSPSDSAIETPQAYANRRGEAMSFVGGLITAAPIKPANVTVAETSSHDEDRRPDHRDPRRLNCA